MPSDVVEPDPERYDVEAVAGQAVVLPITIGPTTGHRWFLELPAGVSQLTAEDAAEPTGPRRVGGSTGRHLRVLAEPGDYTIGAKLARPWGNDAPVRTVSIQLHVEPAS